MIAGVVPAREPDLEAACNEGIAANMERWRRFAGLVKGDIIELQALEVPQRYGAPATFYAHATGPEQLVTLLEEAERWRPPAPGLYQILGRVDPNVARRAAPDTWHRAEKRRSTSDRDVTHRLVVPIDLDVCRPSGISTSEEELARSAAVADEVLAHLLAAGVPRDAIARGASGNGRWLAVALARIPAHADVESLVRGVLESLHTLHGTCTCSSRATHCYGVKIDRAMSDAKRLGPAWGTWKRKGADTPDAPHRRSGIVVPEHVVRLSLDQLADVEAKLRAELPEPKARTSTSTRSSAGSRSDGVSDRADPFALANAVPIEDIAGELGLLDGDAVRCPRGCSGGTSVVFLDANVQKCSHATCADAGVPGKPGCRTAVDLWAEKRGIEPIEAAREICAWRGIALPEPKRRQERPPPLDAPPPDGPDDYQAVAPAVARPPGPEAPPRPSLLTSTWKTMGELGPWLDEPPPARRWLLRRDGTGAVAAGIVGMLAAPGGRGKTMLEIQLALSVATGRPWLDTFDVARPGRVLLALAEEPPDEVRRRIWRAARDLDEDERRLALQRIVPLGLHGELVSLVDLDPTTGSVAPSVRHAAMLEQLEREEYAAVILDPLSRFCPDVESSNGAATGAVQCLEQFTRTKGMPTVIVAHHTAKWSRREGNKGESAGARGVTGLTDAVRWVAALEGATERDIAFATTKSNYAPMGEPVQLVRDPDTGILRRPTRRELEALEGEALTVEREQERDIREAVRTVVGEHDELSTTRLRAGVRDLLGKGTAGNVAIDAVVAAMLREGELHDRGDANRHRYTLSEPLL